MVRANCANRNAKIRAPSIPSAGPEIEAQCTLPGRGRRNGLRAGSRASGGRAGFGGRCARASSTRIPETRGCDARSRVASAPTDRVRIPAKPDGARAPQAVRQRPASSRTTRKDFWCG
jgi:hypothetical protein